MCVYVCVYVYAHIYIHTHLCVCVYIYKKLCTSDNLSVFKDVTILTPILRIAVRLNQIKDYFYQVRLDVC